MKFNFFTSQSESVISQIFQININKLSQMSSINSINSSVTNISNVYDFKKVMTFKEKSKLSSFSSMRMNLNYLFEFFICRLLYLLFFSHFFILNIFIILDINYIIYNNNLNFLIYFS